jgi:ABC-type nitrate/sulfonate/bicarbonate transport system substrate-binding protein
MRILTALVSVALSLGSVATGAAQEKIKYASAVKFAAVFYLPVLAAEEKGIFKKNGIDEEWFPARSGSDMQRDFAASAIQIGSSIGSADVLAIARGVPVTIVANLQANDNFAVWVATNSRFHAPEDLKGAKLGVSQLGGAEHAYGRLVAKRLGLTNDVQFVGTGGIQESLAILVTGSIDGVVLTPAQMINLKLQGKVSPLVEVEQYQPKPWVAYTITARKDFVQNQTDTLRRVVGSILEANRFIMSPAGKPWAIAKMKEESKYSDEAAGAIYATLDLSRDGKIEPKAIKNLTDFMVEYDLLKASEVPPTDSIFTDAAVR